MPAKTCGTIKVEEEGTCLVKTVKLLQGGPSVVIHATIWQKVKVTILVFTIAPGGKESEAIFGTTGRTGYLLLFPL